MRKIIYLFLFLFCFFNCLERAKAEELKSSCAWFGTGPVCAGECPPDWIEQKRSSCNNEIEGCGSRCYLGSKAYCCKNN